MIHEHRGSCLVFTVMCINLMNGVFMLYKTYITTSAVCYFYKSKKLWKVYILNVQLYSSTIICTCKSLYFKF